MPNKNLGKKLKKIRTELGFTQASLAKKAGLHTNVVAKIEQGVTQEPALETIEKISKALGIKASDWLGY